MGRFLFPSALILAAANIIPLVGVLYWRWDLFLLLFLYWTDTAIIGFWMIVQAFREPPGGMHRAGLGVSVVFLTFHAGMFMGVHFLFLWALFSGPWRERVHDGTGFLEAVILQTGLWVPIFVMFIGRGLVTLIDLRKAYSWATSTAMPPEPPASRARSPIHAFYARIVVMHLTILGGAFLAQAVGTIAPLIVMIALKTAIDLGFEGFAGIRTPDISSQAAAAPGRQPPARS
jgi:hypothetical protein